MMGAENRSSHTKHAPALWVLVAVVFGALLTGSPLATAAPATKTSTPRSILGIPVPASERVKGTTTTTSKTPTTTPAASTPTSTTPTSTTPATTTPASATPASGAQPGTVAPTTTPSTPATTTPTTPATTTQAIRPTAGSTVAITYKRTPKSTRLSTGALALVVFGALLVLGCLVWGLARWLALEPRWAASLMHSLREATYRASATWAEFSDWLRLGH